MNSKFKIFFCAVLVFEAIASIQAVQPFSYENDVTKQMDEWIGKLLKINTDSFKKLLSKPLQKGVDSFTHTMKEEINPLGSTLHFHDITANITEFKSPQLNWKFSANKMSFFLKELTFSVMGTLREEGDQSDYSGFYTCVDFQNISFTLALNDDKTKTNFTYDRVWIWYNEKKEIYWYLDPDSSSDKGNKQLNREMRNALSTMLRQTIINSKDVDKALKILFSIYSAPKNKLVSTHADFFSNKEQKYYYLIPKIPYFSFNLKNVFIKGIWNLEWMKISTGMSLFSHTLMIRDVQGSFLLDFGAKPEKPVELNFKIDYLSLSTDRKTVNVDARCYSVNKTSVPLSYRQSALIMQRIETAVANSVFPSLEYRRTYEIDSPLDSVKTDDVEWNTVKKSFHEWIPFNEDVTPPKQPAAQIKT